MSRTVEEEKTVRAGGNGQVVERVSQSTSCILADWTVIGWRCTKIGRGVTFPSIDSDPKLIVLTVCTVAVQP